MFIQKNCPFHRVLPFTLLVLCDTVSAEPLTAIHAEEQVKTQTCRDNENIDETLKKTIRSHSQRDLGWWVFPDDGAYNVERTVLVSKSFKIRYRWHVAQDGRITPASQRAEDLCSSMI
jgi:hypothetical protein